MIGRIINLDGTPGLRVSNLTSVDSLYHLRVKSLTSGITTDFIGRPVDIDGKGDVMPIHGFYDEFEQVAFRAEYINEDCFRAWFESDDPIGLFKYAKMTDKGAEQQNVPDVGVPSREMFDSTGPTAPAEDQDHEQDHQDHEPEAEPGVVQNEPETDQNDCECVVTRELTDLQRSVMRCLSMEDCSVADIAEAMGRTTNSDKVQIRKTCHDLVDMGLAVKKDVIIQNGRPAQIWGVM